MRILFYVIEFRIRAPHSEDRQTLKFISRDHETRESFTRPLCEGANLLLTTSRGGDLLGTPPDPVVVINKPGDPR